MPEVLSEYAQKQDVVALKNTYDSIILPYLDDVDKYARNDTMGRIIRHVISKAFNYASARVKFQGFGNSNYKSREVGEAFDVLQKAMLLQLIYPVSSVNLPLSENLRKTPRLQLLDTGLVNYFGGFQKEVFGSTKITDAYEGRIAEHIVGQELAALSKSPLEKLHFWTREKRKSDAEVDFVRNFRGLIIPIEVKSGIHSRLRSLHQFVNYADHPWAIRIYSGKLSVEKHQTIEGKPYYLLNFPFYLTHQIDRYLDVFTTNPDKLIPKS